MTKSLVRSIPDEWEVFQAAGVSIPLRNNLFVPDLVVVPGKKVPPDDERPPFPAGEVLLVVEITSKGNADVDRGTKLWSYAHAGVPLCLLIDRFAGGGPVVELHSVPDNGVFMDSHRVGFGKPIHLPAPFGLELETAEF